MEGEEEAMTGLLQLRLMPRSYLPATPVQSRPPGIIGQPKVFADCTTLQPDQSLKNRVLDCCTLCNISQKIIYKSYQYSSFSGEQWRCIITSAITRNQFHPQQLSIAPAHHIVPKCGGCCTIIDWSWTACNQD